MNCFKTLAIVFAIIFGISLPSFAARQDNGTVKGRVIEKAAGTGLGWATVALMTADSTVVAGAVTDEDGNFSIQASTGSYILSACMIGFKDWSSGIIVKTGVNEIETICLEDDAQMLAGATVTEHVKLIEMKLDKVVMNIAQSTFAQGSNALDLVKKAPGITIDKDGNIKLNGKSVSVWIDGRPSYMDGKTLESLLRATNGESIEKFEIMEHPSSKYDAEGQGGIINIKTKKNLLAGLNGSMGLGGGAMYFDEVDMAPWQQSFWLNLAYRTKKTNTFFNIYEGFYNTPMILHNDFFNPAESFEQYSTSVLNNYTHNYNVKLGNDWFINDRNTVGAILYIPGSHTDFNTESNEGSQFKNGTLYRTSNTGVYNTARVMEYTANLNYTHIFDEARSAEITSNLDYYHSTQREDNSQNDTLFFRTTPVSHVIGEKFVDADKIYNIYSAKTDYQTVLWEKYMLEAGAKWALSKTDNSSVETATSLPSAESDFQYREHVAAAYFSLAGQLGPKFSVKAGLRGEYTNSLGDWKTSAQRTERSYFDLFPTVFVGYNPSEKWRLSASYTRRIDRPGYREMNPTKTYVDANTYMQGDPDILPQYSNEISLSAGYGQYLSLSAGFAATRNTFNQIPSYGADGTQYLTWGNYGNDSMEYIAANVAMMPVYKWLYWTLNASGYHIESEQFSSSKKTNCIASSAYTDFTFMLPKDWKMDIDCMYTTPMKYANLDIKSRWVSNLAVKKNLMEDKMSLSFRLDDIFRSTSNDLDILDADASGPKTLLQQKYFTQKLLFEITWNFGTAKQTRHRNVGNLEEMSRASSKGLGK